MRKVTLAIAILAGFAALPAKAQTQCARFQILGTQNQVDHNPFTGAATSVFQVQVDRLQSDARQIRFVLVDDDPAAAGGSRLGLSGPDGYDLGTTGEPDRGFASASRSLPSLNSAVVDIPGASAGVAVISFRLTIPQGRAARAGTHVQELSVGINALGAAERR